jgi:hypothetical protein
MKLKLTELQKHQTEIALHNARAVLHDIKLKPLKGDALTDMKVLEQAVQHLECFAAGN